VILRKRGDLKMVIPLKFIYGSYCKEKVKNRVANPTKNNPYLLQKTEKKRDRCDGPLTKNTIYLIRKFV
jgi:hypothetical protein